MTSAPVLCCEGIGHLLCFCCGLFLQLATYDRHAQIQLLARDSSSTCSLFHAMPFSKLLPTDLGCADSISCKSMRGHFGDSNGGMGISLVYPMPEKFQIPRPSHIEAMRLHLAPTNFGAGTATAGLQQGSDFLFSIDSGKAWDDIQELLKTPAVLSKHGKDYEYWVSEADDTTSDLRRAKDILQEALAEQAPQPEEEKPETNQE